MKATRTLIILLLCSFLLNGCGVKFVYRNLDFFIPWYVDDFVDLNREQEKFLDSSIEKHLIWHRQAQLPKYIIIIDDLLLLLDSKLSEEQLIQQLDRIQDAYQRLLIKIKPDLISLLNDLSNEQVEEIFVELNDMNEDFIEDNIELSEEKFRRKRLKSLTRTFRKWFGKVNPQQKTLLKEWTNKITRSDSLRHQYHLKWQAQFRAALKNPNQAEKSLALQQLIAINEQSYSPQLSQTFEANKQLGYQYIVKLQHTLTTKQRQRFRTKLADLSADLNELREYQ